MTKSLEESPKCIQTSDGVFSTKDKMRTVQVIFPWHVIYTNRLRKTIFDIEPFATYDDENSYSLYMCNRQQWREVGTNKELYDLTEGEQMQAQCDIEKVLELAGKTPVVRYTYSLSELYRRLGNAIRNVLSEIRSHDDFTWMGEKAVDEIMDPARVQLQFAADGLKSADKDHHLRSDWSTMMEVGAKAIADLEKAEREHHDAWRKKFNEEHPS